MFIKVSEENIKVAAKINSISESLIENLYV